MSDEGNQRWRNRRSVFVPPSNHFNPRDGYEVAPVGQAEAREFVQAHHYSHTYPADRVRLGLFHRGHLVGVAIFSAPSRKEVVTNPFPGMRCWLEGLDLGRFVLLDAVGFNGETWFLARCRELLGRWPEPTGGARSTWPAELEWSGFRGLVSFSDPTPRADIHGRIVKPGHKGTIYRADNATRVGTSAASRLRLLPDGSVYHNENLTKIRYKKKGWQSSVQKLLAYGAPEPGDQELAVWLDDVLKSEIIRPLRHPGNLKFAWALPARGRAAKKYAAALREDLAAA